MIPRLSWFLSHIDLLVLNLENGEGFPDSPSLSCVVGKPHADSLTLMERGPHCMDFRNRSFSYCVGFVVLFYFLLNILLEVVFSLCWVIIIITIISGGKHIIITYIFWVVKQH